MKRDRILGGRGGSIVQYFSFVLLRGRSPPPTDHAITAGGAEAPPSRCDGAVRRGGATPPKQNQKKNANKLALNGSVAASWKEND